MEIDNVQLAKSNVRKQYCSYHHSSSHSDEDYNRKKKYHWNKSANSSYSCFEKFPTKHKKAILTIELSIGNSNQKHNTIIDTGSTISLVSKQTIDFYNVKIERSNIIPFTSINGQIC